LPRKNDTPWEAGITPSGGMAVVESPMRVASAGFTVMTRSAERSRLTCS
jgi:hypothetical protein